MYSQEYVGLRSRMRAMVDKIEHFNQSGVMEGTTSIGVKHFTSMQQDVLDICDAKYVAEIKKHSTQQPAEGLEDLQIRMRAFLKKVKYYNHFVQLAAKETTATRCSPISPIKRGQKDSLSDIFSSELSGSFIEKPLLAKSVATLSLSLVDTKQRCDVNEESPRGNDECRGNNSATIKSVEHVTPERGSMSEMYQNSKGFSIPAKSPGTMEGFKKELKSASSKASDLRLLDTTRQRNGECMEHSTPADELTKGKLLGNPPEVTSQHRQRSTGSSSLDTEQSAGHDAIEPSSSDASSNSVYRGESDTTIDSGATIDSMSERSFTFPVKQSRHSLVGKVSERSSERVQLRKQSMTLSVKVASKAADSSTLDTKQRNEVSKCTRTEPRGSTTVESEECIVSERGSSSELLSGERSKWYSTRKQIAGQPKNQSISVKSLPMGSKTAFCSTSPLPRDNDNSHTYSAYRDDIDSGATIDSGESERTSNSATAAQKYSLERSPIQLRRSEKSLKSGSSILSLLDKQNGDSDITIDSGATVGSDMSERSFSSEEIFPVPKKSKSRGRFNMLVKSVSKAADSSLLETESSPRSRHGLEQREHGDDYESDECIKSRRRSTPEIISSTKKSRWFSTGKLSAGFVDSEVTAQLRRRSKSVKSVGSKTADSPVPDTKLRDGVRCQRYEQREVGNHHKISMSEGSSEEVLCAAKKSKWSSTGERLSEVKSRLRKQSVSVKPVGSKAADFSAPPMLDGKMRDETMTRVKYDWGRHAATIEKSPKRYEHKGHDECNAPSSRSTKKWLSTGKLLEQSPEITGPLKKRCMSVKSVEVSPSSHLDKKPRGGTLEASPHTSYRSENLKFSELDVSRKYTSSNQLTDTKSARARCSSTGTLSNSTTFPGQFGKRSTSVKSMGSNTAGFYASTLQNRDSVVHYASYRQNRDLSSMTYDCEMFTHDESSSSSEVSSQSGKLSEAMESSSSSVESDTKQSGDDVLRNSPKTYYRGHIDHSIDTKSPYSAPKSVPTTNVSAFTRNSISKSSLKRKPTGQPPERSVSVKSVRFCSTVNSSSPTEVNTVYYDGPSSKLVSILTKPGGSATTGSTSIDQENQHLIFADSSSDDYMQTECKEHVKESGSKTDRQKSENEKHGKKKYISGHGERESGLREIEHSKSREKRKHKKHKKRSESKRRRKHTHSNKHKAHSDSKEFCEHSDFIDIEHEKPRHEDPNDDLSATKAKERDSGFSPNTGTSTGIVSSSTTSTHASSSSSSTQIKSTIQPSSDMYAKEAKLSAENLSIQVPKQDKYHKRKGVRVLENESSLSQSDSRSTSEELQKRKSILNPSLLLAESGYSSQTVSDLEKQNSKTNVNPKQSIKIAKVKHAKIPPIPKKSKRFEWKIKFHRSFLKPLTFNMQFPKLIWI